MRERDDKRGTRAAESCGRREAPAAKPQALGVRPADAGAREGIRPEAGCGWAPHESARGDRVSARKGAVRERAFPFMTNRGTLMRNTRPFGSRPGEKGTRTRTGRTDTGGRAAVGRAGSFTESGRTTFFPVPVLRTFTTGIYKL